MVRNSTELNDALQKNRDSLQKSNPIVIVIHVDVKVVSEKIIEMNTKTTKKAYSAP